jgi:hypothetical protein
LMWPSSATSCLTRFRRRRTPGSARLFSDDPPNVANGLRGYHCFGEMGPRPEFRSARNRLHQSVLYTTAGPASPGPFEHERDRHDRLLLPRLIRTPEDRDQTLARWQSDRPVHIRDKDHQRRTRSLSAFAREMPRPP